MSCKFHSQNQDEAKCKICGAPLCKQCDQFQQRYGGCPSCANNYIYHIYQNFKRGKTYNILSIVFSALFVLMYIVNLCTGPVDIAFIIIGAIVIAVLVPASIVMFVYTQKNLKKFGEYLQLGSQDAQTKSQTKSSTKSQTKG